MKKKYLAYIPAAALILSLMGAGAVSAHGLGFGFGVGSAISSETAAENHQKMFEQQANLLGVSVDEVKTAWASGKSFFELAQEKGLTQEQLRAKMQEQRLNLIKDQLSAMVSKGVITQAQADQRLQFMQSKQQNKQNRGLHKGFGHMGF